MVVGPLGRVRASRGRVSVELSVALSVAADDRARRTGVLLGNGIPDAHLHRRSARYALALLGAGARDGAHVVPDAGRLGRAALRVAGRRVDSLQSGPGDAGVLQGLRSRAHLARELR